MEIGGGVKSTLKLMHWNAGHSCWETKRIEVEALILETKPDMLFISEANLRYETPACQKDIQGYYIVTPNTEISMGYSRIILLVREGVQLTILNNCMDDNIPAIWVKLTSKGKKPLTIGGIYREFHHLLQPLPNLTDDRATPNK